MKSCFVKTSGRVFVSAVLLSLLSAAILFAQTKQPGIGLDVGNTAPDFSVKMTDGSVSKLSALRGKPVVLHFWATWCPPCVRELPLIVDLAAARSGEMTVLAVSVGENFGTVSSYLQRRGGSIASFVSGYDDDASVSVLYRVRAVPSTLFIDSNGVIRKVHVGAYTEDALAQDVNTVFN